MQNLGEIKKKKKVVMLIDRLKEAKYLENELFHLATKRNIF